MPQKSAVMEAEDLLRGYVACYGPATIRALTKYLVEQMPGIVDGAMATPLVQRVLRRDRWHCVDVIDGARWYDFK